MCLCWRALEAACLALGLSAFLFLICQVCPINLCIFLGFSWHAMNLHLSHLCWFRSNKVHQANKVRYNAEPNKMPSPWASNSSRDYFSWAPEGTGEIIWERNCSLSNVSVHECKNSHKAGMHTGTHICVCNVLYALMHQNCFLKKQLDASASAPT